MAHVRDGVVGAEECRELIWLAKCMEAGAYRPSVTSATLPLIAQTQPELLVLTLAVRGAFREAYQRLLGTLLLCLLLSGILPKLATRVSPLARRPSPTLSSPCPLTATTRGFYRAGAGARGGDVRMRVRAFCRVHGPAQLAAWRQHRLASRRQSGLSRGSSQRSTLSASLLLFIWPG